MSESPSSGNHSLEPIDEQLENENELQRKELVRLLGTAKDGERKQMLQRAIMALDNAHDDLAAQEKFKLTHSPAVRESVLGGVPSSMLNEAGHIRHHPAQGPLGKVVRPISAQRQRSLSKSNLTLDAIPEVNPRSEKSKSAQESEYILELDDVADVQTSSCDSRFPPRGALFGTTTVTAAGKPRSPSQKYLGKDKDSNGSSPSRYKFGAWFSTGMVPQFITISFFEKWKIERIEVICSGITELGAQLGSNAASKASGSPRDMLFSADSEFIRTGSRTFSLNIPEKVALLSSRSSGSTPGACFVDDGRGSTLTPPPIISSPMGSRASSYRAPTGFYQYLTLTVLGADGPFFCVSNVKITVQPNS